MLEVLEATIERMRQAGDDEQFVAEDAGFHARVAEASGNGTLASLLAGLSSRTLRVRVLRAMSGADRIQELDRWGLATTRRLLTEVPAPVPFAPRGVRPPVGR